MRPLLVTFLGLFCLGIVWTYSSFAEWLKPPTPEYVTEKAQGLFSARIQLSFDQANDSTQNQGNDENTFLQFKLNGKKVHVVTQPIQATQIIEVDNLNVDVGENRIFVSATSLTISEEDKLKNAESFLLDEPPKALPTFLCVRVQIYRDGILVQGADFTAHADGLDTIILDKKFTIDSSPVREHTH